MEPEDDFSPDEMKAYGTQQTLAPSSPVKTITQPTHGDEDFTADQMKSYGVYQETAHSAPLPPPKPWQEEFDSYFKPVTDAFSQGLKDGDVSGALSYYQVATGKRTLQEAQLIAAQEQHAPRPDLTRDGMLIQGAAEIAHTLGEVIPGLQQNAVDAVSAPIVSVNDLAQRLYAVATTGSDADIPKSEARGLIGSWHQVAVGGLLKDLTDEGVPLETALPIAQVGGVVSTALQIGAGAFVGAGGAKTLKGGIAMEALPAGSAPLAKKVLNLLTKHAKDIGITAGILELNNISTLIAQTIGKATTGKPMTPQEFGTRLIEGLKKAGLTGAILHGTAQTAATIGKGTMAITGIKDRTTPTAGAQTVHAAVFDEEVMGPVRERSVTEIPEGASTTLRAAIERKINAEERVNDWQEAISAHEEQGLDTTQLKTELREHQKESGAASRDIKRVRLQDTRKELAAAQKAMSNKMADAKGLQAKLRKAETDLEDATVIKERKLKAEAATDELKVLSAEVRQLKAAVERQEKQIREDSKAKLKRVLQSLKPIEGKSRFDAATQRELDVYKSQAQGTSADRRAIIDNYEKVLTEHLADKENSLANVPDEIMAMRHVAEIAKQVDDAFTHSDPGRIRDLAEHIDSIARGARKAKLAKLEAERAEMQKTRDEWLTATLTEKGKVPTVEEAQKLVDDEAAQFGGTFAAKETPHTWYKRYGSAVYDLGGKLRNVVRNSAKRDELVDGLGIAEAVKNMENAQEAALDEAADMMRQATGRNQKGLYELIRKLDDEIDFSYVDKDGTERAFGHFDPATKKFKRGTVGEALDAHLRMQEKALRDGIEQKNGFTYEDTHGADSTQARLKDALGEDNLKLATAFRQFYQKYGKRLAAKYEEVTGLELPLSDDYSGPTTRLRSGAEKNAEDAFETNLVKSGMAARYVAGKTGSTIAKTENALGVKLNNPFRTLNKHIAETEQFINLHDTSKTVNAIFGAGNISQRRAINSRLGAPGLNAIDGHLVETFKGAGPRANLNMEVFDHVQRGAGVAFLGGKPQSLVKQATGIFNFLHYVSPKELTQYSAEFWTAPKKNTAMLLEKSPQLKKRYADYLSTQMGTKVSDMSKMDMTHFEDFMMGAMKAGDKLATMPGMYSVYKSALKKGKTDAQAIHLAEEAFTETQASKRIDQVSNFGRNKSTKLFAAFSQQQVRTLQIETEAWQNYAAGTGSLHDAIRASTVNRLAQGAFVAVDAALIQMLKDTTGAYTEQDSDNAWWSAGRSLLVGSTLPIAGSAIHTALTAAQNKVSSKLEDATDGAIRASNDPLFKPSNLVEDAAANAAFLVKDVVKVLDEGISTETALDMAIHWERSGNLATFRVPYGAPARFAKKYMKNAPEDSIVKQAINEAGE